MAEMLKGGVIMDVVTPEQAKIAEDAGAVAVMALERVPADIRARRRRRPDERPRHDRRASSRPSPSRSWPRPGSATSSRRRSCSALGVDYIDESEVLTPADEAHHIDKWAFTVPFVCGATNLGEALRRIAEGAAMIRSKGEAGTGNVVEAVRHMRAIRGEIRRLSGDGRPTSCTPRPRSCARRTSWSSEVAEAGKLPGRAVHRRRHRHPGRRRADDAARRRGRLRRLRHLQVRRPGRSAPPPSSRRPPSTTTPKIIAEVSRGLGEAMVGINVDDAAPRPSATPTAAGDRCMSDRPVIGVLALQGDVREHLAALAAARRRARVPVRRPEELDRGRRPGHPRRRVDHDGQAGRRLRPARAAARARSRGGMPAYGSCAGMIMLADRILDAAPDQETSAASTSTVRRNAFGRQVDSFEADLDVRRASTAARCTPSSSAPPGSRRRARRVEVLARVERPGAAAGRIVAVRQGNLLATVLPPGTDRRPPGARAVRRHRARRCRAR